MKGYARFFVLRIFLAVVIFTVSGLKLAIYPLAGDGLVVVYTDEGTDKIAVDGTELFTERPLPGYAETACIKVVNLRKSDVYYRCSLDSDGSNALYRSLDMEVSGKDGLVYEGELQSLRFKGGPIEPGKSVEFDLRLSLPVTAGNETAGKTAAFNIVMEFADNKEAFNDNDDAGEDGGEGDSEKDDGDGGTGGSDNTDPGSGNGSTGGGEAGGDGLNGGAQGGGSSDGGPNGGGASHGGSSGSGSSDGGSSGSGAHGGSSGGGSGSSGGSGGTGLSAYVPGGKAQGSFGGSGVYKDGNVIVGGSTDKTAGLTYVMSAEGGGEERVYDAPDPSLGKGVDSGVWLKEGGVWRYRFKNGSYAADGFAFLYNPFTEREDRFGWFYFDGDGKLMIGWIRTKGDIWYHSHETSDGDLGVVETGWITESEDGKLYYADETDAKMLTGWVGFAKDMGLDPEYYYFARLSDTYGQNWFFNTSLGRWIYDRLGKRSYGSMYSDEVTPDGFRVDASGRWTEEK